MLHHSTQHLYIKDGGIWYYYQFCQNDRVVQKDKPGVYQYNCFRNGQPSVAMPCATALPSQ